MSHVKLADKVAKGRKISFAIGKGDDIKGKVDQKRKMQDKVKQKLEKFMPKANLSSLKKSGKVSTGRKLSFAPPT